MNFGQNFNFTPFDITKQRKKTSSFELVLSRFFVSSPLAASQIASIIMNKNVTLNLKRNAGRRIDSTNVNLQFSREAFIGSWFD